MQIKIIETTGLNTFEYNITKEEFNKYQNWCSEKNKILIKELEKQNKKIEKELGNDVKKMIEHFTNINNYEYKFPKIDTTFYAYLMESK